MTFRADITVNGEQRRVETDGDRSLLSMLRDDLDLTGSKYGCGEGRCGACTVLMDGKPIRSCMTAISQCVGRPIVTIEGLEQDGKLHPVQDAFLQAEAMQCGYCTPGMIMAGVALLAKNTAPTPQDISRALEGHICRCGIYSRIVQAVQSGAKTLQEAGR
jgi:aerobic-type carbon monoxide dehydrogenase small subunit (CoxS/CutS family)